MKEVLRAVTDCPAVHGDKAHMLLAPTIQLWRNPGGSSGCRPQRLQNNGCRSHPGAIKLPGLSRHMGGYREPPSVPARPDIDIPAISLLAACCGVAGARVN